MSILSSMPNRAYPAFASFKIVSLTFFIGLSGCARHPEKALKACRYQFNSFAFSGMDAGQTHWRLDISIVNPNKHPVTLVQMKYSLLHDVDTLLSGANPIKRELAVGDSQVIQTTLDIPNTLWKRLPADIWSQTDAKFLVVTDAYLDTWAGPIFVPGAMRQTVHVNMPEQVAKYRDMLMQKMFSWPGNKLDESPTPGPK
jgi:hypothetical protein